MTRIELVTSSLPRKRSTPELHRRSMEFERETRLELATFSLEGWSSTNWATPAFKTFCGESRIRTCEGVTSRFTVCPRWPLEYLPNFMSRWRDSNPRPADYKSAALANWATSALVNFNNWKNFLKCFPLFGFANLWKNSCNATYFLKKIEKNKGSNTTPLLTLDFKAIT